MLSGQARRRPDPGARLTGLHETNARRGYLPAGALRQIAAELGVPLSQMCSAVTFSAAFSFLDRY